MTYQPAYSGTFPDPAKDSEAILRLVPHFFIIGERKCGTSSLFRYLLLHPDVLPGKRKEPNFFAGGGPRDTLDFQRYLSQFPEADSVSPAKLIWPELDAKGNLYEEPVEAPRMDGRLYVTGEASANTFYEGHPEDVRRWLPDVRLILLFRDPVERAFSHHRMFLRFQEEGRDLGRSIGSFEEEMTVELHHPGAFLAPGIYIDQLMRWDEVFPSSQRLVLLATDLDQHPQSVMSRVFSHLGLPGYQIPEQHLRVRYNQAPQASMSPAIRQRLDQFYAPHNTRLSNYLNITLPWSL